MFISFPYLVHSSEICHVVDKDVYFDDIVDIGSCSFENCCEIFDGLMLFFFPPWVSLMKIFHDDDDDLGGTYRAVSNGAFDEFAGGVDADAS